MTLWSAIPCANRARNGRPVHNAWPPIWPDRIAPWPAWNAFLRRYACTTPFCGIVPFYKKRDRNASRSLSPIGPDGCNKIRPHCVQPAHAALWCTPKPVFYNATARPLHLAACIRPHRKGRVGSKMPNCVQSPTDRAVGVQSIRSTRGAAYACAFQPQSPASIPVTRLPAESLARPLAANETPMSAIFGKADSHAYHRYGGPCRKGVHPCKTHAI